MCASPLVHARLCFHIAANVELRSGPMMCAWWTPSFLNGSAQDCDFVHPYPKDALHMCAFTPEHMRAVKPAHMCALMPVHMRSVVAACLCVGRLEAPT